MPPTNAETLCTLRSPKRGGDDVRHSRPGVTEQQVFPQVLAVIRGDDHAEVVVETPRLPQAAKHLPQGAVSTEDADSETTSCFAIVIHYR